MDIRRIVNVIMMAGLTLTLFCPMADLTGNSLLKAQQPAQVKIHDSDAQAIYANRCRVIGTSEEVILEFALSPQSFGEEEVPIHVEQRVVINYYTAKRTLYALELTVARHEKIFGQLEIDPSKRLKSGSSDKKKAKLDKESSGQLSVRKEKQFGSIPPLYANFCRVTGTPEEIIFDLALNPQPFGVSTKPIPIKLRIINSFYTAKRLMKALQSTIQRHEEAFGVLEIDVQKRMKPSALPGLQE